MVGQIQIWENDPASSSLVKADKPNIKQLPFRYTFPPPALAPDPDTTSPNFRYWNAAEALRRGADFWGPAVPDQQWFGGPDLEVRLNVGTRWNANYDRRALNFYRGQLGPGSFVYAAGSADMLCHELGHAILDAVQPLLWNSGNAEAVAFHESFGDVSAILCALQIETMRNSILASTNGNIYCNSRLSRIAEQFGTALHTIFPDDADQDCLRNAWNPFCYAPPTSLPPMGPSSILTARSHSFSRVFTGAVFESLAGMLAVNPPATPDRLRDVTFEMRDIMIEAVRSAPVVPQFYASVAAKMVLAASARNGAYRAVFRDAFVRRLILSLEVAANILSSPTANDDTGFAVAPHTDRPTFSALPSSHYGLDKPLHIELPADPVGTAARSATRDGRSMAPLNVEEAVTTFVDRLFMRGRVDYGEFGGRDHKGGKAQNPSSGDSTHRLELVDDQLWLRRIRICCGQCMAT
ncbi:hypothetical protein QN219_32420 [Sinorhizobium sp. 7-81]|uniref:hypothetical protein n=1 Tax=Sinorhizobium sp. 8-89 TaxID=3049089 RepID=UPI0024C2BAB7|nr:hypothetical protein [Sinorhizobium sp. 8-89]MDK1494626.1 hypothetical protein [Sinorhizobium sp. 8-89]